MKAKEVQEVAAKFNVVHREAFATLNEAMTMAELDKASKNSQEVVEIFESYQKVRERLMEAMFWYKNLHQCLMVRSEEGKENMRKYIESLAKAKEEEAAKSTETPAAATPDGSTAADAAPAPAAEPVTTPELAEGVQPCLKLL